MKKSPQEAMEILKQAYQETVKRATVDWQPIMSTKVQLEYCIDALLHKNDRSRLEDIMFYKYAMREFEAEEPEYADILYQASAVVDLMVNGEL
jgi:hypothetical protein